MGNLHAIKLIICTHGHPDHIEASDHFDSNVLRAISSEEHAYLQKKGKNFFSCQDAKHQKAF